MDARTEEIRARVEKATPEPWTVRSQKYDDWGMVRGGPDGYPVAKALAGFYDPDPDSHDKHRKNGTDPYDHNAQFIAHARSDVPYLLTELTALREEVERLKGALGRYGYHEHGCSFRPTRAGRITGVPCDCGLHKAALSPSPAQQEPDGA